LRFIEGFFSYSCCLGGWWRNFRHSKKSSSGCPVLAVYVHVYARVFLEGALTI
jgi:hypothetical protein